MIKRLGVIVPSSNTTMEPEFWELAKLFNEAQKDSSHPITLNNFFGRMALKEVTLSALEEMEKESLFEAEKLAHAQVDLICYGCTSGSFISGKNMSEEITEKLTSITQIQSFTTAQAIGELAHKLVDTSLSVITPYTDDINIKEKEFLEAEGFTVDQILGMGIVENTSIGRVHPIKLEEFVINSEIDDSDALFISCTNLPTLQSIIPLSEKLNMPVFSSNTASFWLGLKKMNLLNQALNSPLAKLLAIDKL
jgi:maleate isomerase